MNNLQNIVAQFATEGTVSDIRPLGNGLINDTYRVITAEATAPDYVLRPRPKHRGEHHGRHRPSAPQTDGGGRRRH